MGLYLALTAAGVLDASFLCGLAVLYGTLLPTTCFSYDEAVHWERYAAATPAGRRGTVDGKYLLALLLAALSGGISLFLTALMEGPESALSLAVLVCTGLALAVNAVNLPLLLLLGVSRSRAALSLCSSSSSAAAWLCFCSSSGAFFPRPPPAWPPPCPGW
ncbi:MAG: ABC-2 transporter permease [Flavonifractor plautii]